MVEYGGKDNVTATVTQADTEFVYSEILPDAGKTVNGSIEALDLTAGTWSGKYNFNITFE